jgi:Domain of unknown function DUF29
MSNYDEDFYAWTQTQARHIRDFKWDDVDWEHIAEEIEALGKSDWRALENHLKNLILHCLKWEHQLQERARRGRGWQTSMDNARDAIDQLLRDNPSFDYRMDAAMAWAYPRARRSAQKQTGLPQHVFPEHCEWTFEQFMNESLWR